MVCSIQSIFQEAEAFLPVSPWDPPEIHWKPEGMLPKNFFLVMVCFLQTFIEPWKPHDRLHGIPGEETLWGRAGKRRRKGAGKPCRENGRNTNRFLKGDFAYEEKQVWIYHWFRISISDQLIMSPRPKGCFAKSTVPLIALFSASNTALLFILTFWQM